MHDTMESYVFQVLLAEENNVTDNFNVNVIVFGVVSCSAVQVINKEPQPGNTFSSVNVEQ